MGIRIVGRFAAALFVAAASLAAAASAGAATDYKKCAVGDRVEDNRERTGTVASVQSDGIYCYVDLDSGEKKQYYIFWMLHLAGTPAVNPASVASIKQGRYECYASAGYLFMDVVIRDSSSYTDKGGAAGTFAYDSKSQLINFRSGPQAGTYAKYLEAGKIGLASRETNAFNVTCNLKG